MSRRRAFQLLQVQRETALKELRLIKYGEIEHLPYGRICNPSPNAQYKHVPAWEPTWRGYFTLAWFKS